MKVCANFRFFYKMDSSVMDMLRGTDMKRKVFPQLLPRESDSYQPIHKAPSHIIKRHFVCLFLISIIKYRQVAVK